jgi:4-hydroxy-tetrahydrodipicolinate reductase
VRLGLFGRGRLGAAIAAALVRAGETVAWQVGREDPPAEDVDCAIDASAGAAMAGRLGWALEAGTPLIAAATGWSLPDLERRVGRRIGVLVAPNLSLTVALYARLVRVVARFAALDPERDPYVLEHHHMRKSDAPGGTARLLAEAILAECPRKTRWVVPHGDGPLKLEELSVSAVRAGHTASTHVVGLDAPGESLELIHRARDLSPYGDGAVLAARWLVGKTGVFHMEDLAGELLDPLFARRRA